MSLRWFFSCKEVLLGYPLALGNSGPQLKNSHGGIGLFVHDTCVDADGDGLGSNGDPFCAKGPRVDCDDTDVAVFPGQGC